MKNNINQNIDILEAIQNENSINKVPESVGLCYRTVWKRIQYLKEIYGNDILISEIGGPNGGGTFLTDKGIEILNKLIKERDEIN